MRNRIFMLCVGALAMALPASAALYRHVDEQGNVTFSDVPPNPAAEPVELPPINTMPAPPAPAYTPPAETETDRPSREAASGYRALAISAPADDQTLRANDGRIQVSISLKPGLRAGDQVRILLDGKPAASGRGVQFELQDVDRGSHELLAEVVGADGRRVAASKPVTFHLQRFSVLH